MRLLLDENVPAPLTSTIKTLLRQTHDIAHVIDMDGWSGTKDQPLYQQAAKEGFDMRDPVLNPPKFWPTEP